MIYRLLVQVRKRKLNSMYCDEDCWYMHGNFSLDKRLDLNNLEITLNTVQNGGIFFPYNI